jgi:hypothetical protein
MRSSFRIVIAAALLVAGATFAALAAVPDQVTLCHDNRQSLSVVQSAVDGHVQHGDTLNACGINRAS